MSFGFLPGMVPKGCEVESRFNCCIIGDTIIKSLFITGSEIDWHNPDMRVALANNLSVALSRTGYFEHCGDIWTY